MSKSLKEIYKELPLVSWDTETFGNIKKVSVWHPSIKLAYISKATRAKSQVWHCPDPRKSPYRRLLREQLGDPNTIKVFWNASFDIPVLLKAGFPIRGHILDAMLLAQLVFPEESSHSLKHFSKRYLDDSYLEEDEIKRYMRKNKCDYGSVPPHVMEPYAAKDAENTLTFAEGLIQKLDDFDMWDTWALEVATLSACLRMTSKGVPVDAEAVYVLREAAIKDARNLKTQIVKATDNPEFNPNSNPQVGKLLFSEDPNARRTTTGQYKVDNLALLTHGSKLALAILRLRSTAKAIGTYYDTLYDLPLKGRLHCNLNQGHAITGRFSSSKPNLQNQPRPSKALIGRIRECYTASSPAHRLVFIDFDQIEIRILAHYSKEPHMIEAILAGEDAHGVTCKRMFELDESDKQWGFYRYIAKRLNFATVYGTGGEKFSHTVLEDTQGRVNISIERARDYINKWWRAHPNVKALQSTLTDQVARDRSIRCRTGRRIPVPVSKSYVALNYLIQGTAADEMKRAIVGADQILTRFYPPEEAALLLTVHDELIFDVKKRAKGVIKLLLEVMENREDYIVPLTCSVEVGYRWGTKRAYEVTRDSKLKCDL